MPQTSRDARICKASSVGEPQGPRMVGQPAVGGDGEWEPIRLGLLLAMFLLECAGMDPAGMSQMLGYVARSATEPLAE